MEFCKKDFLQTILPAAGPVLLCGRPRLTPTGSRTSVAMLIVATRCFRCRAFLEMDPAGAATAAGLYCIF